MNTQRSFPDAVQFDGTRLLAGLPAASAQGLLRIGLRRRYRAGALVQQRGDAIGHALLLLSGRLRSTAYTASGGERLTGWMEPGDASGFSSVLGNAPAPVDLVAVGAVEVLLLPRQALLEFLAGDTRACLAIARMLSLRVNMLFDLLFIGAQDSLSERVWAALQQLAAASGQATPTGSMLLHISQSDLSLLVGASRQRVNAQLRSLQNQAKVRLGYRWIEMLG